MTASQILALVARTEFRPFTKHDWQAFAGCNSDEPLIGENGDYTVVIDGETIEVLDAEGEQFVVSVVDSEF